MSNESKNKLCITGLIIGTICIILLSLCCCSKQETYENGVPTYFLEPDDCVIVEVYCGEQNFFYKHLYYGYITKEEYDLYLSGDLKGVIKIQNPYTEGNSISINSSAIVSIKTGIYQDIRSKNK